MKAWLSFDRTDPEEEAAFQRASQADKLASFLWDYDQWMRTQYKYGDVTYYQNVREKFNEQLMEAGIYLDDLIR